jgi:MoxR-like ATPase
LAPFVFGHRIILKPEARYEGVTVEDIINNIIAESVIPIKRFAER